MFHWLTAFLVLLTVCSSARADTLVLANGDQIHGEIVEWAIDHVVMDHPQLGRIRLSLDQLDISRVERPTTGLFDGNFLRGWSRRFDLGINGKEGNSVNLNLVAGMDFRYEDDFKRWKVTGRYLLNADEDGTSDNYARIDVRRDWLLPGSRWFARTNLRYQFDEFESWEHRAVAFGGPGYNLIRREAHTLDVVVGPAFTREFGERKEEAGEALFEVDYAWKMSKKLSLSLSNQMFYEVGPDFGEFRNVSLGEWKIALLESPELSLNLGAENEYESEVEAEDKKNDFKYYLSIGLDF